MHSYITLYLYIDWLNSFIFFYDPIGLFFPVYRNRGPDTQIAFDKFHLMKLVNEVVDEVRREERKRYEQSGSSSEV